MKRKLFSMIAVIAVAVGLGVAVPGVAGAAPYCGIRWGSTAKSLSGAPDVPLTNIRAGRHTCFDRLVFDLRGRAPGMRVRYVSGVPYQGESGTIPLRGGAFLDIVLLAPAYDSSTGSATYRPANRSELVDVRGWRTFRQVAWGGSFEGQTTVGLGVRARLPFRAFALAGTNGTSRLVVDVAHQW